MKKDVTHNKFTKPLIALALLSIGVTPILNAQLVNINPNKSATPWMAGGVPALTPKRIAEINAIPEMTLSTKAAKINLPAAVDNSQYIYMPKVINQDFGSCAQASGISYVFAYEINCKRNLNSKVKENEYPELFTYNFVNGGENKGSHVDEGWQVLKEMGCPNRELYTNTTSYIKWASGYNIYYQALHNRVESYYTIDVSTETGLLTLKNWLHNHNNGSSTGGLASFSTVIDNLTSSYAVLASPSSQAGHSIFFPTNTHPQPNGGRHEMTIVGYDDSVKFDYNGDGKYTNNLDIDGKNGVTMADWEIGAFKIVNSYGTNWPSNQTQINDKGYAYFSYRNCAYYLDQIIEPQYAIDLQKVYIVKPIANYTPQVICKATISCPERNKVFLTCVSKLNNNNSSFEPYTFSYKPTAVQYPMSGDALNPEIEVAFDYTGLDNLGQSEIKLGMFTCSASLIGTLHNFSVLDYRGSQVFELESDQYNITTQQYVMKYIGVDYDLLPAYFTSNYAVTKNKIIKDNTHLSNYKNLTVSDNCKLSIYNAILTIDVGTNLILRDNVQIVGKQGVSKIVVNGNVYIYGDVTFDNCQIILNNSNIYASAGATLTINGASINTKLLEVSKQVKFDADFAKVEIKNGKVQMNNTSAELYMYSGIDNVIINNVKLTSNTGSRNNHQGIDIRCNNFSISNSTFEHGNYGLHISRTQYAALKNITNCYFTNNYYGLFTSGGAYNINNCTFTQNSNKGLSVYGTGGSTHINNCSITGGSSGLYVYGAGTGAIYLNETSITGCNTGIYAYNSAFLRLKCSNISNNYAGIELVNNSTLHLANLGSIQAGNNSISGNNYAILGGGMYGSNLDNYFYMHNGYNALNSGSYVLSGDFRAVSGGYYNCYKNLWRTGGGSPRYGHEYASLKGSNGVAITPYDPSSLNYFMPCAAYSSTMQSQSVQNNVFNSEIGESVITAIEYDDNLKDSRKKSSKALVKVLMSDYKDINKQDIFVLNTAYIYLRQQLVDLFQNNDAEAKILAKEVEKVQKKLRKEFKKMQSTDVKSLIDYSHTLCLQGFYNEAVEILNNTLINKEGEDYAAITIALCQIESISEFIYNPDYQGELPEMLDYCEKCNQNRRKSGEISSNGDNIISTNISLSITPNPVKENIFISIDGSYEDGIIEIYNLDGKVIYSQLVRDNKIRININNYDFAPGLYIASFKVANIQIQTKKFLVAK